MMFVEVIGVDGIIRGRKEEGNGKYNDLEGFLLIYGKDIWKNNRELLEI